MVKGKKKQEVFFRFDEKAREELEKAKKWFGLATDEEVFNKAFALLFFCREVEEVGDKVCVWHHKTSDGTVIGLHKGDKEKEVDVDVELEDGKKNGLKN